jgi:ribosomal protein S18 acetylase RimI-like enzyme
LTADPFQRAIDFLVRIEERSYTSKEQTPWGPAFFNDRFPSKYDLNYVHVEKAGDPDSIRSAVDEIQGRAGLSHRKIQTSDASVGAALAPAFKGYGWMVERLVVMAHSLEGSTPEPREEARVEVKEMAFEELRPSLMRWELEEAKHPERVARQLVDSRTLTEKAVSPRYFAGSLKGRIAGWCELYVEDGTAQIESVCTFTEFRNHGVARGVILRALKEGQEASCDFSFLIADDEDWPKELYKRLGYKELGYLYDFTQPAD